ADPVLHPVAVADLRPTQMTVGLREVEEKRKRWRKLAGDARGDFLGRHMLPCVTGPKGRHFVVDHHHLGRALLEEGVESVLVTTIADLSRLAEEAFWIYLDNRSWTHLYDAKGRRRHFDDMPKSLEAMEDDPFRSLAGEMRRAGAFAKDAQPYSEFLWADFLRRRLKAKAVKADFSRALREAMALAKSPDADFLPGWCGKSSD
ncbi:MAG: chromosome partitioning protein ParB, partial [Hyphomicrobiales bacterium]|nr:chromosome partitioning protein ParB [Hyphomicrobiales bacterium]